jgi:hypothetical protein
MNVIISLNLNLIYLNYECTPHPAKGAFGQKYKVGPIDMRDHGMIIDERTFIKGHI